VSGSNPKWTIGRLRKIRNLSIHDLHSEFWVTRSCRSTGGQDAINLGNVLGGQPNLQGANIILKVPSPLGAGIVRHPMYPGATLYMTGAANEFSRKVSQTIKNPIGISTAPA
jgi:hypothetical protein